MAPSLAHVTEAAHALWPLETAEAWDAPGLIVGDPAAEVTAIHLAVDAVLDTADEALERGAQLLLVHHPLLLRGVTSVAEDRYKGAVIARLIRGGCALLAAHTNADIVEDGSGRTYPAKVMRLGKVFGASELEEDPQLRANARNIECVLAIDPSAPTDLLIGQRVQVRFSARGQAGG